MTIVIVGGVAGGASAATRARRMNEQAEIILFEQDEYVSFANCGLPYYLGGEITDRKLLVATPEFLARRFRLDVRTRQEVQRIDRIAKTVSVFNRVTGETYTHFLPVAWGLSPRGDSSFTSSACEPGNLNLAGCARTSRPHPARLDGERDW